MSKTKTINKVTVQRINPISISKDIRNSLDAYKRKILKKNPDVKKISDAYAIQLLLEKSNNWKPKKGKKTTKTST